MKQKIAKLIDLKSIITILITGCLVFGFVTGKISNEQFMTIATMIFTFYFAKKEKKEGDEWMATLDTRTEEEIKAEQEQCAAEERKEE